MDKESLKEKLKNLNFTKEEEFKVEQTNQLIEMLDKLRVGMVK